MSNADERLVDQYAGKSGLIARYLGVKQYKMKTMTKTFPVYKKALFFKAVTEVIKNYDERVAFDLDYSGIIATSFQYLEVGRDKNEELMVSGYRFLIKDGVPLSVNVYQTWTGSLILNLSYADKHSTEAILFVDEVLDYMKDNNFYIGEKIDANGNFLKIEDIEFDDIVLDEKVKKAVKVGALDFFSKKQTYLDSGLDFKRGILLTGNPGTGKTMLGKAILKFSDSTFIWATASELQDSNDIKYLFSMAKDVSGGGKGVVLFLEDIDDFLEKTNAVDILKTTLDGFSGANDGIVTIICTNFPSRVPTALLRPGRVDDLFILQLPNEGMRYKILDKVAKNMDVENREEIFKDIAKETEGLTPACLKEIIIYSLLLAADDSRNIISEVDLATALLKVQDSRETITERLSEVDEKRLLIELNKKKS